MRDFQINRRTIVRVTSKFPGAITILEKIKVQDVLLYFSFDIYDLIQKLVTEMKLINRASK